MAKHTIEGVLKFETEDGGQAKIAELSREDSPLFVRVQSWVDGRDAVHPQVEELAGKRVRVTIEIIE
jgi:hypothetical protein